LAPPVLSKKKVKSVSCFHWTSRCTCIQQHANEKKQKNKNVRVLDLTFWFHKCSWTS